MKKDLLSLVKEDLKIKNKDLYRFYNKKSNRLDSFFRNLYKLSFYKILGLLMLCSIIISVFTYLNITWDLINYDFKELLKTITTSSITLVSMNLFVTNLLLTHLKEERDDLEKFILNKINFVFVTYFGFSIILFLVILNISHEIIDDKIKSNILLFLSYCFIVFIILLIYLYNIIFKFIIKSKRNLLINKELEKEFSQNLYKHKFHVSFNSIFLNHFSEKEIKTVPHNLYPWRDDLQNSVIINNKFSKDKYFRNIKLHNIKKEYKNISISEIKLNQKIIAGNEIFLSSIDPDNKKIKQNKLKSAFIFTNKPLFGKNDTTMIEIILDKFDKDVKNQNMENLKIDLQNINTIFDIYYKNC